MDYTLLGLLLFTGLCFGAYVYLTLSSNRWWRLPVGSMKGKRAHFKLRDGQVVIGVIVEVDPSMFRPSFIVRDDTGLMYFIPLNAVDAYKQLD